MAQEVLLERSLHNPTLRDRLPIVTHTLAHKKKVNGLLYVYTLCEYGYSQCFVDMEKFLFSDENISIDPVVSLTKSLPMPNTTHCVPLGGRDMAKFSSRNIHHIHSY